MVSIIVVVVTITIIIIIRGDITVCKDRLRNLNLRCHFLLFN